MARRFYYIDFSRLVEQLTPFKLRKPVNLAWFKSIIEPIKSAETVDEGFRLDQRYKAVHNSQIIYLEKMLNERFSTGYDVTDHDGTKDITIAPGEQLDNTYIYQTAELKPLYIDDGTTIEYVFTKAEIDAFYADFIVEVDSGVTYDEAEMRALIDYFVDTKFYKIKVV